jgi:hypothetical protein
MTKMTDNIPSNFFLAIQLSDLNNGHDFPQEGIADSDGDKSLESPIKGQGATNIAGEAEPKRRRGRPRK